MMKLVALVWFCRSVFAHSVNNTEKKDIGLDSAKASAFSMTWPYAIENAKEATLTLKTFVDLIKDTPTALEDPLDMASKISFSFGAIASGFAFAFELIDKGKSKELMEIEAGFNLTDTLFDKTQDGLKELEALIRREPLYSAYEKIRSNIARMIASYEDYRTYGSKIHKHRFITSCTDVADGSRGSLSKLQDFVGGSGMGTALMDALLDHSRYDYDKLREFFAIIMNDLITTGYLLQACMVADEPLNVALRKDMEEQTQEAIQGVAQKFNETAERMIESGIEKYLKSDLNETLHKWSNKRHMEFCWELKRFLETKYFWSHWNVIVSDNIDDTSRKDFVYYRNSKNSFLMHTTGRRTLMVTWAVKKENQFFKGLLSNIRDYIEFEECSEGCRRSRLFNALSAADTYLILSLSFNVHVSLGDNGDQIRLENCAYLVVYTALDP